MWSKTSYQLNNKKSFILIILFDNTKEAINKWKINKNVQILR